jgi:hypothetical protein
MGMTSPKCDLPQGTLDLLILKTVALGPVHGYAIAQRLQQIHVTWCRFREDLFILRCTAWSIANSWWRSGGEPKPGATRSSTD